MTWYRRAAEQGEPQSQYNLGVLLSEGRGAPRDDGAAAEWFRRAAEQGDPNAQFALAGSYFEGRGVDEDMQQGMHWRPAVAADQDFAPARRLLSDIQEE
ncbi:MAG: tetratricopeptide repeat protein [Gammaproteobacteria bacterium]|nr:tetratricopeptide repeat protein [Gammaproteobacteria bacterium]